MFNERSEYTVEFSRFKFSPDGSENTIRLYLHKGEQHMDKNRLIQKIKILLTNRFNIGADAT